MIVFTRRGSDNLAHTDEVDNGKAAGPAQIGLGYFRYSLRWPSGSIIFPLVATRRNRHAGLALD